MRQTGFGSPKADRTTGNTRQEVARPEVAQPERPGEADGKRALFSSAVRRPGTLVVECSRCHGRTRLSYAEFAQRHLPYWMWTPWRRYSRYVVCPACGQRAWLAARWFE